MEHEVYVPFSVARVRAALADRERVVRCVPGLKPDDEDEPDRQPKAPVDGRLRLRIGNSTITYRGSLTIVSEGDGIAVRGSGTESRGSGSVTFSLTVVPRPAPDGEGTRLVSAGTGRGDGRLAEFEEKTATAAGRRLLDRFATSLADSIREAAPEPVETASDAAPETADEQSGQAVESASGIGDPDDNERAIPGIPSPEGGDADSAESREAPAPEGSDAGDAADTAEPEASDDPAGPSHSGQAEPPGDEFPAEDEEPSAGGRPGVFETEVPPPSLDPSAEELEAAEAAESAAAEAASEDADRATAEAAHARRTMIGRSAEEVDHAPPRGRYAPVPATQPGDAAATLRWAGPAAAVVVAGAVVIGRALRRRR